MPAIFPVAYFGPISYYQKMVRAEEIALELHEHYVKQTLRNRMSILGPNGIQHLTIPVVKPQGNKTLTKDILISEAENWRKKHWKAVETAYSPSPYFEHYGIEVRNALEYQSENLVDFNLNIHRMVSGWLGFDLKESVTETYEVAPTSDDFRNDFKEANLSNGYNYVQVFAADGKFVPDLSILDAVFNLGPMARKIIVDQRQSIQGS